GKSDNNNIYSYTNYKEKEYIKKEKEEENELKNEKEEFEKFRCAYPGIKRGLDTEFENFRKKHKDYREVLPRLLPLIKERIRWVNSQQSIGIFVPQYPNLRTWINQRRWEEETPKNIYFD
ncbi:MAG: hypothetical protein LUG98_05375, partial [Tannerellaceae bacterium]|nr:hypothetical protein [Tannerellaceae bacterium]